MQVLRIALYTGMWWSYSEKESGKEGVQSKSMGKELGEAMCKGWVAELGAVGGIWRNGGGGR